MPGSSGLPCRDRIGNNASCDATNTKPRSVDIVHTGMTPPT
jgi:hypothetical protein